MTPAQLRCSKTDCKCDYSAINTILETLGMGMSLSQAMGDVVLHSHAKGQRSGASTRTTAAETG